MTVEKADQYRTQVKNLIREIEAEFGITEACEVNMYLTAALMALDRKWKGEKNG